MGSEQNRFPQQERRKRWGGCFGALSCFGSEKGGKRIVPASSRIPDGSSSAAQGNGGGGGGGEAVVGLTNQPTPSLLAPPSSPASFSNSAIPSTAQSPSCFLSANSPGNPSSTMFATGPYAHETQLVSPPVFSTFTTEPSTAPLTPPPELAHLTTPSSPDVPFARFLTSSMDPASYMLYPGSPLRSPISRNSRDSDREFPLQWDHSVSPQNGKYSRSASGRLYDHQTHATSDVSQDSNFFCPATFAQFYIDHNPPFPLNGGRLSVSKDSDVHPSAGNVHQNRQNRSPKQDAEEIEAYRASFGFSADEIITTTQYVEISDVMDDSFMMTPFPSNKPPAGHDSEAQSVRGDQAAQRIPTFFPSKSHEAELPISCDSHEDPKTKRQPVKLCGSSTPSNQNWSDDDIFSKMGSSVCNRKHHLGLSSSDAEIDYRRGRSLREGKGGLAWHD